MLSLGAFFSPNRGMGGGSSRGLLLSRGDWGGEVLLCKRSASQWNLLECMCTQAPLDLLHSDTHAHTHTHTHTHSTRTHTHAHTHTAHAHTHTHTHTHSTRTHAHTHTHTHTHASTVLTTFHCSTPTSPLVVVVYVLSVRATTYRQYLQTARPSGVSVAIPSFLLGHTVYLTVMVEA